MTQLPRKPREAEIVLRLRAVIAANYKLGSSSNSSSSSSSSAVLSDFLDAPAAGRTTLTNAGNDETLNSSSSSSSSSSGSGIPGVLAPPRLFLGEVIALGPSVQGVTLGAPLIALSGLGPQEQHQGILLYCLFLACAPLPNPLLNKLLTCAGLSTHHHQQQQQIQQQQGQIQQQQQQQQQQRQLQQHEYDALGEILSRVPHLMEALQSHAVIACFLPCRVLVAAAAAGHCLQLLQSLFLLLHTAAATTAAATAAAAAGAAGAAAAVCCCSVSCALAARLYHEVEAEGRRSLGYLLPRLGLPLHRKTFFLLPLMGDLEAEAMRASGGYGLTHLLVTPTAAALLQQQLQQQQLQQQQQQQQANSKAETNIHSNRSNGVECTSSISKSSKGSPSSSSSSSKRQLSCRSLMSLLLLCLAPGGIICSSSILEGLDEEEALAMLQKSAGYVCFNPSVFAVTQAGTQLPSLPAATAAAAAAAAAAAVAVAVALGAEALQQLLQRSPLTPVCLRLPEKGAPLHADPVSASPS
ncbi:hypothetical protein Emag_002129 [Eimeria magna]